MGGGGLCLNSMDQKIFLNGSELLIYFFLGSITPLKSGELLKTKMVKLTRDPIPSGIAAFLVERTLDAIGIALVGLASSIFLLSYHDDGHSIFIVALTVFCFLGLFGQHSKKAL